MENEVDLKQKLEMSLRQFLRSTSFLFLKTKNYFLL